MLTLSTPCSFGKFWRSQHIRFRWYECLPHIIPRRRRRATIFNLFTRGFFYVGSGALKWGVVGQRHSIFLEICFLVYECCHIFIFETVLNLLGVNYLLLGYEEAFVEVAHISTCWISYTPSCLLFLRLI